MSGAWAIHHGDCIEVMQTLAAESIDAVITSPPYAMQRRATYGGVPEADYPGWTVSWMREVRRVLKLDGNVVINIRPHIRNGQISDYTLRTRLALREDGWTECEELIWHKRNVMPAGANARPRRTWESLHWFAQHGRPYSAPKAAGTSSSGRTVAAFERITSTAGRIMSNGGPPRDPGTNRVADVVSLAHTETTGHPAPYPSALAEWIAALICPPGGTILDPFNGSGSTGVAAIRHGYSYVGIDSVAEYAEMSRLRLDQIDGAA